MFFLAANAQKSHKIVNKRKKNELWLKKYFAITSPKLRHKLWRSYGEIMAKIFRQSFAKYSPKFMA